MSAADELAALRARVETAERDAMTYRVARDLERTAREQAEAHAARLREALASVQAALQRLMIPAQHWTAGNEAVERETETVITAALAATPAESAAELAALREGRPDDLRALGWAVAVHNDYRHGGESWTFWLFTRGTQAIKGEGRTDAEALRQARQALAALDEAAKEKRND